MSSRPGTCTVSPGGQPRPSQQEDCCEGADRCAGDHPESWTQSPFSGRIPANADSQNWLSKCIVDKEAARVTRVTLVSKCCSELCLNTYLCHYIYREQIGEEDIIPVAHCSMTIYNAWRQILRLECTELHTFWLLFLGKPCMACLMY